MTLQVMTMQNKECFVLRFNFLQLKDLFKNAAKFMCQKSSHL